MLNFVLGCMTGFGIFYGLGYLIKKYDVVARLEKLKDDLKDNDHA